MGGGGTNGGQVEDRWAAVTCSPMFARTGTAGSPEASRRNCKRGPTRSSRQSPSTPGSRSHSTHPRRHRPFTLTRFLAPYKWPILASFVIIVIETFTTQAGPWLIGKGIDVSSLQGRLPRVAPALAVVPSSRRSRSTITGRIRLAWTGRVGERLMFALRVRVFTHLQRLGIDFYTREKAGRIMTRMTSDIENLQQLFSEGLINLIVQGLTLFVVAGILFAMNVRLAAYTVGIVVPVLTVFTLWFRHVSDKAFLTVRDRIADVLSDLSESLSGIRIIAAYNRQRYNTVKHRNVVGEHRDANNYTAKVGAIYGPGTDAIGTLAQVVILFIGGTMIITATPATLWRSVSWPRSSCTCSRSSRRSSSSCRSTTRISRAERLW